MFVEILDFVQDVKNLDIYDEELKIFFIFF